MQQPPPPDLPPTGDQLGEDLYTSATADLSAGGVAMAREATKQDQPAAETGVTMRSSTPITDPTPAQAARENLVSHPERPTFVTDYEATEQSAASRIDPTWAIASGALVALGGGVGGAWLYSRWQRERNRPINRLRRRARGFATTLSDRLEDVGDRLPDVDEMRDTAPMSGGAAAMLFGGLALARLLHVGGWGQAPTPGAAEPLRAASRSRWGSQLRGLRDLDSRWGSQLRGLRDLDIQAARNRVQSMSMPVAPVSPRPMGMGMGAILAMCGTGYLVWRLLRRGAKRTDDQTWYVGSERREQIPNQ